MKRTSVCEGAPLTPLEREVLYLRAEGLQIPEMVVRLDRTKNTIQEYDKRVRVKMGARTMAQAVANAYHTGILKPRYVIVETERKRVSINRAQALAFFNLSQRLPLAVELEIADIDNYDALIVRAEGNRYKLPRRGGHEDLGPEPAEAALSKPAPMVAEHNL